MAFRSRLFFMKLAKIARIPPGVIARILLVTEAGVILSTESGESLELDP